MTENFAFEASIQRSSEVIASLADEVMVIKKMASKIYDNHSRGLKLLVAGNGGSYADAEHFAGELQCTFVERQRNAISAISLPQSLSAITAWSNDFEYESFLARQVDALGFENEILFLISTSGGNTITKSSLNLINAAKKARDKKLLVFSILGRDGGELKSLSNLSVVINSQETAKIQEAHITIIHLICGFIDFQWKNISSHNTIK